MGMQKRGSSYEELLGFFTKMVAAALIVLFLANFFKSDAKDQQTLADLNSGLEILSNEINTACSYDVFSNIYHLKGIPDGVIEIDGNQLCIFSDDLFRCDLLVCNLSKRSIPLDNDLLLNMSKNETGFSFQV